MVAGNLGPIRSNTASHARLHLTDIHCGAPPIVACGLEMVSTTETIHSMMALCQCDACITAGGSKLGKFTDLRQLVSIFYANINPGAPPVEEGTCGFECVCSTAVTHATMAMCRCDMCIMEQGIKFSTFTGCTQMVRTNVTSFNSGALPTVPDDLELVCTAADTHTIMTLCECHVSLVTGGSMLCKFTDLRQLVSFTFANINSGALPVMTDDRGFMCSNTAPHVRLHLTGTKTVHEAMATCRYDVELLHQQQQQHQQKEQHQQQHRFQQQLLLRQQQQQLQ